MVGRSGASDVAAKFEVAKKAVRRSKKKTKSKKGNGHERLTPLLPPEEKRKYKLGPALEQKIKRGL